MLTIEAKRSRWLAMQPENSGVDPDFDDTAPIMAGLILELEGAGVIQMGCDVRASHDNGLGAHVAKIDRDVGRYRAEIRRATAAAKRKQEEAKRRAEMELFEIRERKAQRAMSRANRERDLLQLKLSRQFELKLPLDEPIETRGYIMWRAKRARDTWRAKRLVRCD